MPTHRDMPPGWDDSAERQRAEMDAADERAQEMRRNLRLIMSPSVEELEAADSERAATSVPPPSAA